MQRVLFGAALALMPVFAQACASSQPTNQPGPPETPEKLPPASEESTSGEGEQAGGGGREPAESVSHGNSFLFRQGGDPGATREGGAPEVRDEVEHERGPKVGYTSLEATAS